jgi:ribosomal protein L40E/ribosomal protein L35AE/L33A
MPIGAQFCRKCGKPQQKRCPYCGVELPAIAEYCEKCGKKLASSPKTIPVEAAPRRIETAASATLFRGHVTSKRIWLAVLTAVVLSSVFGGFILGPVVNPPVTITSTVTSTITTSTTVLQPKWMSQASPTITNVISWEEAKNYVGQTKTVEGRIFKISKTSGNVYLRFHDPYQGYFYGMISSADLKKFPFDPINYYFGKEVRVTGKIELYQGAPRIIISSPSQVEVAYLGLDYP